MLMKTLNFNCGRDRQCHLNVFTILAYFKMKRQHCPSIAKKVR